MKLRAWPTSAVQITTGVAGKSQMSLWTDNNNGGMIALMGAIFVKKMQSSLNAIISGFSIEIISGGNWILSRDAILICSHTLAQLLKFFAYYLRYTFPHGMLIDINSPGDTINGIYYYCLLQSVVLPKLPERAGIVWLAAFVIKTSKATLYCVSSVWNTTESFEKCPQALQFLAFSIPSNQDFMCPRKKLH